MKYNRQEIKDGLEYMAESPQKEFGGFHPNAVEIAKGALKMIEPDGAIKKIRWAFSIAFGGLVITVVAALLICNPF